MGYCAIKCLLTNTGKKSNKREFRNFLLMSPSERTSQRNWRRTSALSQKDAFEFPFQVVLILVGLLPTSTNTLSVGTWLPRTTNVPMRKTNVITWPLFTTCALQTFFIRMVLLDYSFYQTILYFGFHTNSFSLGTTKVWFPIVNI